MTDDGINYDPETCMKAAEKFLVGDMTYCEADVTIAQTGSSEGLDYWIDRYFEQPPESKKDTTS